MPDADIIPFPSREPVVYDDEADPPDYGTDDLFDPDDLDGFTMTSACESCGSTDGDHHTGCGMVIETDPDEIVEADGRWVWQPLGSHPPAETPVGMVSYRIETMCRWTHRHLMEGQPIPQECCYSVLVTLARLPGPVQEERNWLALQEEDPS